MKGTYNYENRVRIGQRSIKTLSQDDQDTIETFVREYGTDNTVSDGRKSKYYFSLKKISEKLGGDLNKPTVAKLRDYFQAIKKSEYTEKTKYDYVSTIKTFYRWWRNKNRKTMTEAEEDAMYYLFEEFKWRKDLQAWQDQRREILEEDDVKRLLDAATRKRDKAYISLFYDLGLRIGELVKLQIRHVKPYAHGFLIDIQYSKKLPREFPVMQSAPYLESWLQDHPDRENPNAPLFAKTDTPLTVHAIETQLKRLQHRAKLQRQTNITPHLFRHSAATRDANNEWTEAELCKKYGWVIGSKQPATYIRSAKLNATRIAERHAGIAPPAEEEKSTLDPITCSCTAVNEPTSLYCKNCYKQLLGQHEAPRFTREDILTVMKQIKEEELRADIAKMKG